MLDRLSVVDASFLLREPAAAPLQLGGLGVFAPGLEFAEVMATLRHRLDRVPLARKRIQPIGYGTGQLAWTDDVDFDLTYHLRHAGLPAPGGDDQLAEFLSRLIARPLDRARPLWEVYVIEGLAGGRVGLFRKVHLAVAGPGPDGGGDILSVLLDDGPVPADLAAPQETWSPVPPPSDLLLAAEAVRSRVERASGIGRDLVRVVTDPGRAVSTAASSLLGIARLAASAPASPLNVTLSPHRRFAMASASLEDFRSVRTAFGGSVNDVVVAVCADAVGRLLRWRGHDTKDLDLKVMVPVRVAGAAAVEDGGLGVARVVGDGVVGVLAPLPVMPMDPVARLYRIMGELAGLKESRQAVAADSLARLAGYGPSSLHAMAARLISAEHRYNVALSNAPGPQEARYLAGIRLEHSYPFIPLAGNAALSIAVSSYAGSLSFGLLGDRAALPDLDLLSGFVTESLADLVAAVGAA